MMLQRILAFLLLSTASVLFAIATRDFLTPGAAVCIAVAGLSGRVQVQSDLARWRMIGGAAVAIVAVLMIVNPYARPGIAPDIGIFSYPEIAHAVGQLALLFQALQLIVHTEVSDRVPRWLRGIWGTKEYFPFYGLIAIITAGDLSASDAVHRAFQVCVLVYAVILVIYLHRLYSERHPSIRSTVRVYRVLSTIVLVLAVGIGWMGSAFLFGYGQQVEFYFGQMLASANLMSEVGYTGSSMLGSVAQMKNTQGPPALRIYADRAPGYVAGSTFDSYRGSRWTMTTPMQALPARDRGGKFPQEVVLQPRTVSETWTMEVWPDSGLPPNIFHTTDTVTIALPAYAEVNGDAIGNVVSAGTTPDAYAVESSYVAINAPISNEEHVRYTAIPPNLSEEVFRIAEEITEGAADAASKARLVERHFTENYEYNIGIDVPPGTDPLEYFLTEQPPAHCEYFASGATVLLRITGVPTRYVTGFVAMEESGIGDYWIARNNHAHAWCEAYIDGYGWTLVEATPAAGVPAAEPGPPWSDVWEYVTHQWQKLKNAAFGPMFRSPYMIAGVAVLLAFVIVMRLRGARFGIPWFKKRKDGESIRERTLSEEVIELNRLLREQDRRVARAKLNRSPSETFQRFASRLEAEGMDAEARWYREYESVRFAGSIDAGDIERISGMLQETVDT